MDNHERFVMYGSPNSLNEKVCFQIPIEVNPYDRRLWQLAPELCEEVVKLRKENEKLRVFKETYERR